MVLFVPTVRLNNVVPLLRVGVSEEGVGFLPAQEKPGGGFESAIVRVARAARRTQDVGCGDGV